MGADLRSAGVDLRGFKSHPPQTLSVSASLKQKTSSFLLEKQYSALSSELYFKINMATKFLGRTEIYYNKVYDN